MIPKDLGNFNYTTNRKPTTSEANKLNVSVCINGRLMRFLKEWREKKNIEFDFTNEENIKELIGWYETAIFTNLTQEVNGEIKQTPPNRILLTYSKSNLGKGFIIWFKCQVCNRKVRFLYIPSYTYLQACRKCHKLTYRSQRNNDSKYLKKLRNSIF